MHLRDLKFALSNRAHIQIEYERVFRCDHPPDTVVSGQGFFRFIRAAPIKISTAKAGAVAISASGNTSNHDFVRITREV